MLTVHDPILKNVPPNSPEAERAVLGAILVDPEAVHEVAALVKPGDFYQTSHALIYEAALALARRGEPVDAVMLNGEMERQGTLDRGGGTGLISELWDEVPTAANASYYAKRVHDLARQRDLIEVAARIQSQAFERRDEQVLADAERQMLEVTQGGKTGGAVHVSEALAEMWEAQQKPPRCWPTGFAELDDQLAGGINGGELVLIGARPSAGKTSLCNSMAARLCERGYPVAFFSLEVPKARLVEAWVSAFARVENTAVRSGVLSEDEAEQVRKARIAIYNLPLWIDDDSHLTVHDVASRARRLVRKHQIQVVFLDYIQRLADAPGHRDRRSAVAEMSRTLKALARELDIPVVVAAQLSRKVEERSNKRPMNSDLKEAGDLEQDADTIVLLHRPWIHDKKEDRTLAVAIVSKQRNGPTGDIPMTFEGEYTRFRDRGQAEQQHRIYSGTGSGLGWDPGESHD